MFVRRFQELGWTDGHNVQLIDNWGANTVENLSLPSLGSTRSGLGYALEIILDSAELRRHTWL